MPRFYCLYIHFFNFFTKIDKNSKSKSLRVYLTPEGNKEILFGFRRLPSSFAEYIDPPKTIYKNFLWCSFFNKRLLYLLIFFWRHCRWTTKFTNRINWNPEKLTAKAEPLNHLPRATHLKSYPWAHIVSAHTKYYQTSILAPLGHLDAMKFRI